MAEMAQTADHLVVIGRGKLIAETSVEDFVKRASTGAAVRVVPPRPRRCGTPSRRGAPPLTASSEACSRCTG
jgi:ABC-2 type transport system ATP-binding protein